MDYLAHPYPPSKNTNTFPILFDLLGARAVIVEDGTGPMELTAAGDVAKVVARAIDSDEPWTVHDGLGNSLTAVTAIILHVAPIVSDPRHVLLLELFERYP